jgi:hypothetical protein
VVTEWIFNSNLPTGNVGSKFKLFHMISEERNLCGPPV